MDFRFWILRKVCSKIPQGAPTSASLLAQRKACGIATLRDATLLNITTERCELIKAFHDGVIKFLKDEYQPSQWSYIDDLSNTNWEALLKPSNISGENWRIRLATYWGGRGRVPETGRETLWNHTI